MLQSDYNKSVKWPTPQNYQAPAMTVALWMVRGSSATANPIFSLSHSSTNYACHFYISSNKPNFRWLNTSNTYYGGPSSNGSTGTIGGAGTLVHLAATWDGVASNSGTGGLFIDGVSQARSFGVGGGTAKTSDGYWQVGTIGTGFTYYVYDYFAHAAFWNVVLSDAEIAALAKGYSPDQIRPASLHFYVPLIRSPWPDLKGSNGTTYNSPAVQASRHPVLYDGYRENQGDEPTTVDITKSVTVPAAWQQQIRKTATAPSAWQQDLQSGLVLPVDWNSSLQGVPTAPVSWQSEIRSTGVAPVEWSGYLVASHQAPVAWTQSLRGTSTSPSAWVGSTSAQVVAPTAWNSSVSSVQTAPVKWDGFVTTTIVCPIAWQQEIKQTDTVPVEWNASLEKTATAPTVWQQSLQSVQTAPVQWAASTNITTMVAPVAWQQEIRSSNTAPVEWFGYVSTQVTVPVSWQQALRQSVSAPMAWQSVVTSIQTLPVRWDGTNIGSITFINPYIKLSTGSFRVDLPAGSMYIVSSSGTARVDV